MTNITLPRLDSDNLREYFKAREIYDQNKVIYKAMTNLFNMGNMTECYYETFVEKYENSREELLKAIDNLTDDEKNILIKDVLIPY